MSTTITAPSFYGHGKLLLTGEYLVLKGAKALAVPLKQGQSLTISDNDQDGLFWQANSLAGHWFKVAFDRELNISETDDHPKAQKLQAILKQAIRLNPEVKSLLQNKKVVTQLEFNRDWGWGSSSTLIHNLSQWLNSNKYKLLEKTIGGSGYDLACASSDTPLFYQLKDGQPAVQSVHFDPAFKEQIWFVYTGQKQHSNQEVKRYLSAVTDDTIAINRINEITDQFLMAKNSHALGQLMLEHEQIIGNIINRRPVQQVLFPEFEGYIKSLGAWGGDYIMAVSEWDKNKTIDYFKTKGLQTVFNFKEIVLNNQ